MALAAGARLGAYEIVALIGAGGMGEVYRARDSRLKRDVAIKILPDAFGNDPERVARFQREAELLATLNHPNIAQIYGIEERALILELIDGPTLADRVDRGGLPLDEALAIARQIAEALEAAHERGIIHRDLKPANIKLTTGGNVKVLDFGLARLSDPSAASLSTDPSQSPTITSPAAMTMAGMIMGTAAYMSPEQARGKTATKRSDIWAFGCVLFEMLSGKRAFEGDDVADTLAAILRGEPPWTALPSSLPSACVRVLRRCLAKEPANRLADIGDARLDILEAAANPTMAMGGSTRKRASRLMIPVALVALLAGAAVTAAILRSAPPVPNNPIRFAIVTPPSQPISGEGVGRPFALSPDGRHIVYITRFGLFTRTFNQLDAVPLKGANVVARAPFFSPDGQWIGFVASGELRKVPVGGGPPIVICRTSGSIRGATWLTDGTIVFATNADSQGLMRVPSTGGTPELLTTPDPKRDEGLHGYPSALPGRNAVIFTISNQQLSNAKVAVLDLDTRTTSVLIENGSSAQYVDSGYLVYTVAGTLMGVRFDARTLKVVGEPVPVGDGVLTNVIGGSHFDISRGTLAYVPGGEDGAPLGSSTLVWVDRQGREEPLNVPDKGYRFPRLSPDEDRIAVDVLDEDDDIWLWEFETRTLRRFTFGKAPDQSPVWSPDGERIVFVSGRDGGNSIYSQEIHSGLPPQRLTTASGVQSPYSMSPDGGTVVFRAFGSTTGVDLALLSINERQITPFIHTPFHDNNGEVSPDGRWIVYESNESGKFEVYVRPFASANGGIFQISSAGGTVPVWSRNGREIFYLDDDYAMLAVPVETQPTFRAGSPARLFDASPYSGRSQSRTFDVAADGRRFLMVKPVTTEPSSSTPASMVVVLNWLEELKARMQARP